MIEKITKQTTFGELYQEEGFCEFGDYLVFDESATRERMKDVTIEKIEKRVPGFDGDGALEGLENLYQQTQKKRTKFYSVYSPEEIKENPELDQVKLFFLPGEEKKPFILVCAGGAYQSVCSLFEGFPVAARANKQGYNAFVLNYRVRYDRLFPRPMEDLARTVKFIMENEDFAGVEKQGYAIAGFSAGGHLSAAWGTENFGYKTKGLPAPSVLMLGYPATQMELQAPESASWFYKAVLGENYTQEDMDRYSVNKHMEKDYPATYITQCRDDVTVPFENSVVMVEKLQELEVPYRTNFGEHGGHGYALGYNTDAKGWFEEAVEFWKLRRKEQGYE